MGEGEWAGDRRDRMNANDLPTYPYMLFEK